MKARPAAPSGSQKCKLKPDSPDHHATETHNAQCAMYNQVGAQELTETRLYATEELIRVLPGGSACFLGLPLFCLLMLPKFLGLRC